MGIRISDLEPTRNRPQHPDAVKPAVNKGEMPSVEALKLSVFEETKLASTYKGEAAMVEVAFSGLPGLRGAIKIAIKFSALVSAALKNQLLKFEIWQDTSPFFDKYLVRVWYAGKSSIPDEGLTGSSRKDDLQSIPTDPELVENTPTQGVGVLFLLPLPVLLTIVVAVGVLSIFGLILWKMSKLNFGEIVKQGILPILIVGGILVGAFILIRGSSLIPRAKPG